VNILITGVGGLLGSRMADWIIANTNHKVIGIDDFSGGYKSNIPKEVKFYLFDLSKDTPYGTWIRGSNVPSKLQYIFEKEKPDIVYHFAAYAAECLSPFIRKYNYTNNIVATANVINECIRGEVDRLIFTSSMAVYGKNIPPFTENYIPAPEDPYGIAKYACEMDIQIAGKQHNLDWCIIRPHNVYGIKQNIWDKYRNVLGIWMYKYLHNEPLLVYGDGKQKRAFSFIDDCLEPMWLAATLEETSKEIINLGGTEEVTINKALKTLLKVIGDTPEIQYCEPRFEVKNAWSTYQKSIDLLNYKHKTSLEEGLSKMWEWAQQRPHRYRKEWKNFELTKGLYTYWNSE